MAVPLTANPLRMMNIAYVGAGGPPAMMGVPASRTGAMATAVCRGGWTQNLAERICHAAVSPDLLSALVLAVVAAAAVLAKVRT